MNIFASRKKGNSEGERKTDRLGREINKSINILA